MIASGCGYSSRDNEVIGQVKRVVHRTPIFCDNHYDVDISLGVIKNGVGSMSNQDIWITITNPQDLQTIQTAASSGDIVKFMYDVPRFNFCLNHDHQAAHLLTHVEIVK